MNYIDWLLWYMLRDIYNGYKAGTLDKDACVERKAEAVDIWERETFKRDQSRQLATRCADLWKNVEEAASLYRKERTLKNADLMLVAIYGEVMRKEHNKPETESTCVPDKDGDGAQANQTERGNS